MDFRIILLVLFTLVYIVSIILISVLFIAKNNSKCTYNKYAVKVIQLLLIIVFIFSARFFYVDSLRIIHNDNIIFVIGLVLAGIVGLLNNKILKL